MSSQDWSHLGDEIIDAVQSAIDSKDFTRLNESIGKTVNRALDHFEQVLDGTDTGNGNTDSNRSSGIGQNTDNRQSRMNQNGGNQHVEGRNWYENAGSFHRGGSSWYQNTGGNSRGKEIRRFSAGTTTDVTKRKVNPFTVYEDRYASPVSSTVFGILFSVFGGITAAGCGIAEFVMLLVAATVFSWNLPVGMPLAMGIMVPFIAGGGLLADSGRKKLGLIKRYKKYVAFLGDKEYCELDELESVSGKSRRKLLKDLRKMIDKGWFRQGHLDQQETSLIVTNQAYRQYMDAQKEFRRRELEAKQNTERLEEKRKDSVSKENTGSSGAGSNDAGTKLPKEVQEVIDEGRGYLRQIKESNDAIPGEEISEKISRMELVIERIFNRVEQHPELVEELRRFMKYYLPTTVKLLKAYEELDRQEIQGPNIVKSKREIEDTLDTINRAFENLLDSFFEDAAVDISSDISVMQTMMTQEGLLGSSLRERTREKEKVLR